MLAWHRALHPPFRFSDAATQGQMPSSTAGARGADGAYAQALRRKVARTKSQMRISQVSVTRRLEGLRSRWQMLAPCR